MIVHSPRHRPGDLEYWRRLEAADEERARRGARRLRGQADRARGVVARAVKDGPCYVSVSWGKDSMVVLDLALSVDPSIRVVHIVQGRVANPDDVLVRDEALCRWALNYVEIGAGREEAYTWADWRRDCRRAEGYGQRITGIRAQESSDRRMSARTHGLRTGKSCRPILWWTQDDVWAWLALRDLPVHPVYAMTAVGAIPREALRVGDLMDGVCDRGSGMGRMEWERHYYGG